MHRRARHLNARHAGAGLVLDARRISGLNDGDSVSTWSDVSGSGRDATNTLTARPLYKTAIQGGQPTVRFDGSNDVLVFSSSVIFNSPATSICVYKRSATNVKMNPLCGPSAAAAFPVYEFSDNTVYISGDSKYAIKTLIGVAWRVSESSITSGPVFSLYLNGSAQSLGANVVASASAAMTYIGARSTEFTSGDISQVVFIGAILSSGLKARLRHSAAFSFKIQCS